MTPTIDFECNNYQLFNILCLKQYRLVIKSIQIVSGRKNHNKVEMIEHIKYRETILIYFSIVVFGTRVEKSLLLVDFAQKCLKVYLN